MQGCYTIIKRCRLPALSDYHNFLAVSSERLHNSPPALGWSPLRALLLAPALGWCSCRSCGAVAPRLGSAPLVLVGWVVVGGHSALVAGPVLAPLRRGRLLARWAPFPPGCGGALGPVSPVLRGSWSAGRFLCFARRGRAGGACGPAELGFQCQVWPPCCPLMVLRGSGCGGESPGGGWSAERRTAPGRGSPLSARSWCGG